ncbi:hypothetical protein PAXINDRAFT_93606 [Paxillus involutus ATCC 200175]|uniref:CxC6 like cysteine cluster associated with KDZ domain-containing protein n=1 Tax=Paxillus involutus ATCC 200175 TaxID=664439 RepID=A0A0C9T1C8_PAXIN|nr:hypothetical protein PAXINDRAFT_93606 [Paxillus involutus ATCC 200175]
MCARLYNIALSKGATPPQDFPFVFQLSDDHVWSAIVQLSLIEDLALEDTTLAVRHGGEHKDHFTDAIRARNLRILVVTDGVTVGRPCCGVHNCHEPLLNNRDRFCLQHLGLVNVCAVIGCQQPTVLSTKMCDLPTHQAVEETYTLRGQAFFQLQKRLQRSHVANPVDSMPGDGSSDSENDTEEEEYEVDESGGPRLQDGSSPAIKLRAQFGRKRTHNEQLIVAPCGMILSRETFYGAEGVASVIEMIKRTFCDEFIKPNHIFYDNNCTLSYMVRNDPYFKSIGLSVDVFHFKCKHSTEDEWCQQHCNPASFEDLVGEDGKWLFNSSVAEQTNIWFGEYHSICREMTADRYAFFLDEMIIQKNCLCKVKLEVEGCKPHNWPTQ